MWAHFTKMNSSLAQCNIFQTIVSSKRANTSNPMNHFQCSHSLKVGECDFLNCLDEMAKMNGSNTRALNPGYIPPSREALSGTLRGKCLYIEFYLFLFIFIYMAVTI